MEQLKDIGEHEAIRRLVEKLGSHRDLIVGAGDDCAVVRLPGGSFDQVLTTYPVIEQIHFKSTDNPVRIGNKAAGRVLSDIAAMGAHPQWLLVDVVAPPSLDFQVIAGLYEGMTALCNRFGAAIIGGDLSQGPCLEIHVFGTGILPAGSARLRSGARPGDGIFVTGPLGGSIAAKHLDFVPRVEEGIFLRESGMVGGMMDISDGLATDLRHMLKQSGVGAVLSADQIPATGSLESALYDGEDFELLFTVREGTIDALMAAWGRRFVYEPVCIGAVTTRAGMLELRFADGGTDVLSEKAYEHFSFRSKPH